MKSLQTEHISLLNAASIEKAADILSKSNTFETIDVLNWSLAYGYKPETKFKIARSEDSLFIYFNVVENNVKAMYTADQDPVWQDSCVEFFCTLPGQNFYYNFEFNCIGTCLVTAREGRDENVRPFADDQLKQIERYASLGKKPFDEKNERTAWELCVKIPFTLIGINEKKLPEKLCANFYKCGDETTVPHYVSWSPIKTENPDFHRPEFFGEVWF